MKLHNILIIIILCISNIVHSLQSSSLYVSDYYNTKIHSPVRMCTDKMGHIYYTDFSKRQACRMDSSGNIQLKISDFNIPMAIAVDQINHIYVSDRSDSSVKIFNSDGVYLETLDKNPAAFRLPIDMEVDGDGNIYIVDNKANCIKVYDSQWNYSHKFGESLLNLPVSIAINDKSGEIIVGQNSKDSNGQIIIFAKSGDFLRQFGVFGHKAGQLTRVQGITVDTEGHIYVCDSFQSVIQIFTSSGKYLNSLGGYGLEPTDLKIPLDVAFLDNVHLLVSSYNSARITVFRVNELGLARETQTLNQSQRLTAAQHTSLLQNYPNPGNPATLIPYTLGTDSEVTIKIFNVLGECIRTFELGLRQAGDYTMSGHALFWDGTDERGTTVSSGVFIYRLQADDFVSSNKLLIMK